LADARVDEKLITKSDIRDVQAGIEALSLKIKSDIGTTEGAITSAKGEMVRRILG